MSDPVAFLFADVQGSTAIVRQLGGRWAGALAQLRGLLRDAVAANGGNEVDARGDELFAVFPAASAAADAALAAQLRLLDERWPDEAVVRVRMGIHCGKASSDGAGGYVGVEVHRAARVASAAHGGQVLLGAGRGGRDAAAPRSRPVRARRAARARADPPAARARPAVRVPAAAGGAAAGRAAAADRARRRLRAAARGDRAAARGRGHGDRRPGGRRRRAPACEVERHRPDAAIVDIRMPPTNTDDGLRAAREIRERFPGIGVLVLSSYLELGLRASSCCAAARPASATCSRTASPTSRRSPGPSAGSPAPERRSTGRSSPSSPTGRAVRRCSRRSPPTSASCWS